MRSFTHGSTAGPFFQAAGTNGASIPSSAKPAFLPFDAEWLESLVRKGYDVAGTTIDDGLEAALMAVDRVTTAEDLWLEAPLQRGQVQYLNNHELGHYRSEFIDGDDPAKKRHLYRLWHRADGDRTYDG